MSSSDLIFRIFLSLIFPPLGIIGLPGVGCGGLLLSCLLTLCFYVPGQICSILIVVKEYDSTHPGRG